MFDRRVIAAALAVTAACAADGGASHDASPTGDGAVTTDRKDAPRADGAADADAATGSGFPATLMLGASNATVGVSFDETATGSADAPVGAVAITAGVGTVGESGVSASAFLYEQQPFGGLTLYQGFAVSAASWNVFWLYCQGATLIDVWDEGVDGPQLAGNGATGACSAAGGAVNEHVTLPALALPAPTPVAAGYTVTGADITVGHDGTGSAVVAGARLPLIVFDTVDCSTCASPGWYELHSLLWDAAHHAAVFVIVYLESESTTSVQLEYARSLPDLDDPIGSISLPATWTAMPTSAARPDDHTRPHGMPPRPIP